MVRTLDEFLACEIGAGRLVPEPIRQSRSYDLFLHCTEKTAMPEAGARWAAIFRAFGLEARVARTGCCGMSGLFGHERKHTVLSEILFEMSWRPVLKELGSEASAVTGFSCRYRAKRFLDRRPRHPIAILLGASQA